VSNHFNFLKDLLFTKRKSSLDDIEQHLISPYLLNNWISGYNPDIIELLNETANKYSQVFSSDKEKLYNFYYNIIPKLKYSHLKYPKSKKTVNLDDKKDKVIEFLSENLEMSIREVNYLIDNGYIVPKTVNVE
jgi:hypothetical protein